LGKGDGTFQAVASYYVGTNAQPFSLAVGDFNRDGKPDVALSYGVTGTSVETGKVAVFLGKGDGTLQPALSYDVIDVPYSVAVGDLNGDGKPDLTVAGDGTSVLLGNGDGSFQAAGNYPGRNVWSVTVGDFNNDSKLDLVTLDDHSIFATEAIVWLNTSCSAGPSLAIRQGGGSVTVSWPSPSAGYVLESNSILNPSGWKPSAATPVSNNGRWEVTQPTSQTQGYFRLHHP
jgi:hypothetical protein